MLIDAPVPALSLAVGAPKSSEELSVRRDAAGRQLCEICDRQLAKIKHTVPCGVGRKCKHGCKPRKGDSHSTTSQLSIPPRSHKRTQPPACKPTTPPSASLTPRAAPPASLRNRHTWNTHGWQMARGNRTRVSMMKDWHRLVSSKLDGGFNGWQQKRAGFVEQNMRQSLSCSLLEQQRVRVVSSAETMARELLRSLGVNESSLRMDDIGCLRTDYKIGLQEIHADIQKFLYAALCYVVIFYLVETESTAVADVPAGELDPLWKGTIAQNVERLKSVTFRTERVFVGDALVMTGATFHYGIDNPDLYQRFVGFLSFTPKSLPPMDSQEQFYPTGIRYV